MKKIKLMALIFILILVLTSCKSDKVATDKMPIDIAKIILETQDGTQDMIELVAKDKDFSPYLLERYMIESDLWVDGGIFYRDGARAEEIAVVLLKDVGDVAKVKELLREYIRNRIGDFTGYAPEQVILLEGAKVVAHGKYVALMICTKPNYALDAFNAVFTQYTQDKNNPETPIKDDEKVEINDEGYIVFNPPNKEDMTIYDTSAIIKASTDREKISTLSDKDKEILKVCESTIAKVINNSMTDVEKELAIHDWIVQWTSYDEDVFSISNGNNSSTKSDNANPYGLLVNKKSNCLGYTTTFQLFMDLLNIECITVLGAAYNSREDHAWNMVKIDDIWYCVDVTWDDPINIDKSAGGPQTTTIYHNFFNITSQEMRDRDHQWDYKNVPETTKRK